MDKVRIDKWLWAVRIYKTRSLASKACDGGRVKIDGDNAKPSRQLKVGEEVQFTRNHQKHLFKVVKLIDRRVGAPEAQACYEDLTPESWIIKRQPAAFIEIPKRDRGAGRPTKKDRREIDKYRGNG